MVNVCLVTPKFIEVAKLELQKGFKEHILPSGKGDNINPYGEWYGMNGSTLVCYVCFMVCK